jgi:DNA-directed RNA polymerase specialized sigma24 family protein
MVLNEQQITDLQALTRQRAKILARCQWRSSDMDEDDIAQELFLRVWKRLNHFNAARAKWEAFCHLIVAQGVRTLFRRHLAPGRQRVEGRRVSLTTLTDDQLAPAAYIPGELRD